MILVNKKHSESKQTADNRKQIAFKSKQTAFRRKQTAENVNKNLTIENK